MWPELQGRVLQQQDGLAVTNGPGIDHRQRLVQVDLEHGDVLTFRDIATPGRLAIRLIQPGQIVFIDGGTTNVQLVRHLPKKLEITVVTHSLNIAVELVEHPLIEVELIGGRLFEHSFVTLGAACAEAIARVRVDSYFMGVTGLHPETGATTGNAEEAAIKRIISRQAAETFVLATREKLGAASRYGIIPVADISTLVTDAAPEDEALGKLSARVPVIHA